MQTKVERSQSLDLFESGQFFASHCMIGGAPTEPRRIRSQSENHLGNVQAKVRVANLTPRDLFGPESLGGTPTDGGESFQERFLTLIISF